jgi:flagellar basal body-associated protein FliL
MDEQPNQSPAQDQTPTQPLRQAQSPVPGQSSSMYIVLGVIILVLIVVAGGYWYFTSTDKVPPVDDVVVNEEPEAPAPPEITSSDDDTTDAIEQDLDATLDLGNLDDDFNEIDSELDQL